MKALCGQGSVGGTITCKGNQGGGGVMFISDNGSVISLGCSRIS